MYAYNIHGIQVLFKMPGLFWVYDQFGWDGLVADKSVNTVKLVRKFAQLRRITHFQCAQILWISHCTPKHIHTLHNIHPSYFPHWNLSSLLLASPKNAHGGMRRVSLSWMSSRYLFFKARAHSSQGKKEYLISVCSISLCVVKYQVYIFSISSYMLGSYMLGSSQKVSIDTVSLVVVWNR